MQSPVTPASPWGRLSTQASRDWARHGHSDTASELASIYRAQPQSAPVAPPVGGGLPRRLRRTVGTLILVVVALGSAGSAFALREALFPETGDATTRSVWQNPGHDTSADTAGTEVLEDADAESSTNPVTGPPPVDSSSTTTTQVVPATTQAVLPSTETANPAPGASQTAGATALSPTVIVDDYDSDDDDESSDSRSDDTPATATVDDNDNDNDNNDDVDDAQAATSEESESPSSDSPPTTEGDDDQADSEESESSEPDTDDDESDDGDSDSSESDEPDD